MSGEPHTDDAIRVVVSPSQASYFAGEPFSVTITFTNTRSPDAVPPRSASHSATHSHKRSAHSISSVPMARPPTSPGTIRSAIPALPIRHSESVGPIARKGLIGRDRLPDTSKDPDIGEPSTSRRLLMKSLSISITPNDLQRPPQDIVKGKSPLSQLRTSDVPYPSPTSPRISSPLARSASFPIAPNHPHARKQSMMDGQLQVQDLRPPPSLSPFSPTLSASTSTYSLSLDPIAESGSSPTMPPMTPAITSPIPQTDPAAFRTQIPSAVNISSSAARAGPRRPPQLGHGPPPAANSTLNPNQPPRTAFSSSFPLPNTELILYSYAQLVGTLSLTPAGPSTPDQARTLQDVRARLLKRQVVGGGSMDITPSLSSRPFGHGQHLGQSGRSSRGRSTSVSSLFSLLSPTSLMPTSPTSSQPWSPAHRARAPSMFSLFSSDPAPGPSGVGLGFGAGVGTGAEQDVDPETPLPTFEMQPSMLAVDLSLAPGESRSYTYTVVLPENLPPTYKGRALRLSYQFILGVCRAASSTPAGGKGPTGANSSSRVMKVPIRVYNHVVVGRQPSPYDLLWPVSFWKSRGAPCSAKVAEEPRHLPKTGTQASTPGTSHPQAKSGTFEDLQDFARNLLSSFHDHDPNARGVRIRLPSEALELERDREREEAGALSGCRQAIEMLTRNPRKASYDVTKDGVKVAVLTFTKSAYRLGETVLGVVELNDRSSRARVLKLSALLEAHESLPSSISSPVNARQTRRVHAEHHSSFIPSTLRTTFSLDIPPDASPAFQVSIDGAPGTQSSPGGLEWKVRLCLLVAVASSTSRGGPDGVRLRQLVRDRSPGDWGASWKGTASIAPMERPDLRANAGVQSPTTPSTAATWLSYFTAPLLGPSAEYHDGDDEGPGSDSDGDEGAGLGDEVEWREVNAEMVECEVPIRVWPGNTAFKATDVVFDV